jgi:hypothetical protein
MFIAGFSSEALPVPGFSALLSLSIASDREHV